MLGKAQQSISQYTHSRRHLGKVYDNLKMYTLFDSEICPRITGQVCKDERTKYKAYIQIHI